MALGIFRVLERHELARRFASDWRAAPGTPGLHLEQVSGGMDWQAAAGGLFGGGFYGNGSAMRVAPLAAYFAEDGFAAVAEQATLSAAVTHAHLEGIAGAVAAAVAGAYAWVNRDRRGAARGLFEAVLAYTPNGEVRDGVARAAGIAFGMPIAPLALVLGNGSRVSGSDTVPLCLWIAAGHLGDYRTAIATAIRAGGDVDTTAAIVGGIVALATGAAGIPAEWLAGREGRAKGKRRSPGIAEGTDLERKSDSSAAERAENVLECGFRF